MTDQDACAASTVMTVRGPIAPTELGTTLTHEHLWVDASSFSPHESQGGAAVDPAMLAVLRTNPHLSADNMRLDDLDLVTAELEDAKRGGVTSVVELTSKGMGREPRRLQEIADQTGLNVVMGSGHYMSHVHPPYLKEARPEQITEEIIGEFRDGVGDSGVRPGVIGEIGVSVEFTNAEQKVLAAAARAQAELDVALFVHMPGWRHYGHRVLDVVEKNGGALDHTVLCHMNPTWADDDYQLSLVRRGAYLGYDMLGMDGIYYEYVDGQCPGDHESCQGIARVVGQGYANRLLLSQDVFMKMQLLRYGGCGYGHLVHRVLPRLIRLGVTEADITRMLVENPRSLLASTRL